MATRVDASNPIHDVSVGFLNSASEAFKSGNTHQGFDDFRAVHPSYQYKVYEQIWVDRNKPQGNPEYGRHSFNDTNGHSSSVQEKAEAIDKYLVSIGAKNDHRSETEARINSIGYQYAWNGKEYVPTPAGTRPLRKGIDDVWCPTTKEDCLHVGIALTAVGGVLSCLYGASKIISALRR